MKKPKILVPYTEAGLGHIMPAQSIATALKKKYSDKVDVVDPYFFSESGNERLIELEKVFAEQVKKQNREPSYGFFTTFNMDLFGSKISTWFLMDLLVKGSKTAGIEYMEKLDPDLVVSTHWATNYYAIKSRKKPLTVTYCPDVRVNPLFAYKADMLMVSAEVGFNEAHVRYGNRFNEENLKLVNFPIREIAFTIPLDKKENRRWWGFDEDKFLVVIAEGGYGIGKMEKICQEIIRRDLPVTLVPICGKNEELYNKFKNMKVEGKTAFYPQGLLGEEIFRLWGSADLSLGKSGSSAVAEPVFFGVPHIVTKFATNIEQYIGEYYIKDLQVSLAIFDPIKAVDKIEEWMNNPEKMQPFVDRALAHRKNYGAEQIADEIIKVLATRYPELLD